MGSWNGTCAISNLHVTSGTEVAVFMLLKNRVEGSFCYGNALYTPCPIPFYGEYDDYGGVGECKGFGLPLVIDAIKSQLFEFEQGDNQYHDISVKRDNFDEKLMFEADHEGRLGIFKLDNYEIMMTKMEIEDLKEQDGLTDAERTRLDMLYARLAQPQDAFQRVTHVIIHGQVFKDICEKHFVENYCPDQGGDPYKIMYLKDYLDYIPAYIERVKELRASIDPDRYARMIRLFEWNDENLAGRVMDSLVSNSNGDFGLINVGDAVEKYCKAADWDGLAAFAKEAITGYWINMFMMETRKLWTKQTGAGSQNSEVGAYRILINSIRDIIDEEDAYMRELEADDEPESEENEAEA